jgi:hypothetical protein
MATTKTKAMPDDERCDLVGKIMEYENGMLPKAEAIELFQRLIDNGMAWQLQGAYGRTATRLLQKGLCVASAA